MWLGTNSFSNKRGWYTINLPYVWKTIFHITFKYFHILSRYWITLSSVYFWREIRGWTFECKFIELNWIKFVLNYDEREFWGLAHILMFKKCEEEVDTQIVNWKMTMSTWLDEVKLDLLKIPASAWLDKAKLDLLKNDPKYLTR